MVWNASGNGKHNRGRKHDGGISNGERISWAILTCIFVGFGIWKREHSGLCDRWQISKAAKRQDIRNNSLLHKIAQIIFLPLLKREGWGFSFLRCQVPLFFCFNHVGAADGRFVVFCLSARTVYGAKPQRIEKFSIANFVNLPKLPRKKPYFCQIIRIFARF